jgi:hypothetical protein
MPPVPKTGLTSAAQAISILSILRPHGFRQFRVPEPKPRHVPPGDPPPGINQTPPDVEFVRSIQYGLAQIADGVVAASAAGLDVSRMVEDVGSLLCPQASVPFPWPYQFPVPVPPGEPYPIDVEDVAPLVQAHGAVVFQSYADRIADDELRGHLAGLADRCAAAAVQQQEIA